MKNRMTRAYSVRKLPVVLVVDEPEEEIDLDMNDSIDKADLIYISKKVFYSHKVRNPMLAGGHHPLVTTSTSYLGS